MKSKTTKILALTAALYGLGLTTPAMAAVPTPTVSLGFDNGKSASTILGGSVPSSLEDWDSSGVTYTKVRGSDSNYAMTISSSSPIARPAAPVPSEMSDNASWSVHGVLKIAAVNNGVLFGLCGTSWQQGRYGIGVERKSADKLQVVYWYKKSGSSTATSSYQRTIIIDNIPVSNSEAYYHSYLLTYDATATGEAGSPRYTLYFDGVKVGDSGTAAKCTGLFANEKRWCVGTYYGGADQVGASIFGGAKVDDFAIWATTCLSAEQAVELAAKFPSKPIQNAYLWLDASDASSITIENGQVKTWKSQNTGGKSATSYTTSPITAGPTVLSKALAGKDVVDFGTAGSNKDLKFDRATNVRAVFMVTQVEQNNNVFLLGDSESFNFHRGEKSTVGYYFSENHACDVLVNGTYRNRVKVSSPRTTVIPSDYGLISIVASSDVAASRICQDRAQSGRNGGKKVAELIILTDEITESQRDEIEQYLTNKWFPNAPTPDMSQGFDGNKNASSVLGGTAYSSWDEWKDADATYTAVRGSSTDKALNITSSPKVTPNTNGWKPTGLSDSTSWSVHASMMLAEVPNAPLFGLSAKVWETCKYIGVEYVGNDQVRVVYGSSTGSGNKKQLIAPVTVTDSKTKYHSYLLTFNASASGTAESPYYTLYVDGVAVGNSGTTAKHTGYAVGLAVGNYYGGADQTGGGPLYGAKVDDFAVWATTCLTVAQAADLAGKFLTWPNIFTATVTGTATWSALSWAPSKPQGGFESNAELTVNNTAANATITMDDDVAVAKLTVTSDTGKNVTFASGSGTITIGAYDFSGANGTTTVGFATGNASVKAGADTVLASVNNQTLTIASGKKLTVKGGSLTYSKTTNDGTLNFEGGNATTPINYTAVATSDDPNANENLGTWTLASNTYVKVTADGNKIYKVTGQGDTSCLALTRTGGGIGLTAGSNLNNLTLVSAMPSEQKLWIERGIGNDVRLTANGAVHLSEGYNPTFVALNGAGPITRGGTTETLTINCAETANYAGTCSIPLTIGGTALQVISGNYTGALTVNSGATVGLKSASPSSLTAQSGAHLIVGPGTDTAAIKITGGTSGLNLSGVTLDIDSFEETAISESAATYKLISDSHGFNTDTMILGDSLTKGNWEVTVVDNVLQAQKKNESVYITIDPTTGTATHDTTSRAALDIDRAWIDEKCGTAGKSATEVTAALNTPAANGTKPWESYVLGLDPNVATSVPVIQPAQAASSNGAIAFQLSNVTVNAKAGANVTYKVVTLSAPGGSEIESSDPASPDETISVALPTSGAKYYKLQVDITNQ